MCFENGSGSPEVQSARTALAVLIGFLIASGSALFGVSIWALVATPSVATYVQLLVGSYCYYACAALLLILSVMMITFGIVGCRGALKDDQKCLIAFYVLIVITTLGMLTCGALAYAFIGQFQSYFQSNLRNTMISYYGTNIDKTWDATLVIDSMQAAFNCCGVTGSLTSSQSWYTWQTSSAWYQLQTNGNGGPPYVPISCCNVSSSGGYVNSQACQGYTVTSNSPPVSSPSTTSLQSNSYMFSQGCYDAVSSYMLTIAYAIGGIGIGFGVCMIALPAVALLMLRRLANSDDKFY